MIDIESIFQYLEKKVPNFKKINKRGKILFTCPKSDEHKFNKDPSVTIMPGTEKFYCLTCSWKGGIFDLIRITEKNPNLTDKDIMNLITNEMKTELYPELNEYKKYGWSLFAIAKNSKKPLKDEHWREEGVSTKDKSKWINWLENGLNLAVNCEFSNVMIVDADLYKEVPSELILLRDELKKMLEDNKTLMQNTPRGGKHYVFVFDSDLCFKQKVNLGAGLSIDTRTHKGYFLVSPSKINNLNYSWVNLGSIIKDVSPELKAKLLQIIEVDKGRTEKMSPEMSQKTKDAIEHPIELVSNNLEGCCNDTFIRFGGVLIKMGLPIDNVKGILFYLNKNWLRNSMPTNVVEAMLGSLEGYKGTEEHTQEQSIYEACQIIQNDISAKDIIDHAFPGDKNKRAIVDKYLAKLHKEGKLSRRGRGRYDCKQAVEWIDEHIELSKEINFKMPYFKNIANFHNSDILLLGSPTGFGKTTIAMNIIKKLKEQGIKPFYIGLESGSRHQKIAEQLGLSQKDYYISKNPIDNPIQIELENSAINIIDWIYTGDDFSQTQSVFKHLNDEMVRKGGILIVFTQLKENYDYFAVNLIKSFPSFVARFIYDSEDRITSHWQIDKIRDPIGNYATAIVSCEYNPETKILSQKNEI